MTDTLTGWLNDTRQQINQSLDEALGEHLGSSRLLDAARYSVLGGGKRLRPLLVYAAGQAVGANPKHLIAPAVSVECLHAYSLIHDDLPAMDDDALRRGQPTTHIAFDEATAILAGDALQALAFSELAKDDGREAAVRIRHIQLLGDAVGFQGMALGQAIDLESEHQSLDLDALQAMHAKKTGALIEASIEMGAVVATSESSVLDALREAGSAIGLAFQIQDDILDETASTEILGKQQGRDRMLGKSTFPNLLGLSASEAMARDLVKTAHEALARLPGDTSALTGLATLSVERNA